jgi:raffinose/stachyose/melibiose transport system substrate-binding protein
MKSEGRLVYIGVALLVMAFVASAVRVLTRSAPAALGGERKVKIVFAHYLVYESNRRYFDAVIRDYERLHPDVDVEQVDVPPPVWQAWRQTRFTGGTAPDIMQVGRGLSDEMCALYMRPLSDAVHEPNPYNRGTSLEGVAWKDTFVDGLTGFGSINGFREQLMEFYGVTTYLNNVRIYYNRDLYRRITGGEKLPETYEDFVALGEKALTYGRDSGEPVVPIAGSIEYSSTLFRRIAEHQTQREMERIDAQHDGFIPYMGHRETAVAWLRGELQLAKPPVRHALEMMRELARYHQPGFLGATRDEAGFLFKQGRTLMIVSGSWDANFLMVDTTFGVGAFDIPLPSSKHPVYGPNARGSITELGEPTEGGFGVPKSSRHPEIAIDFLRYLTSLQVNQRFANECLRVPVIEGAKVPAQIEAFAPNVQGYAPGFNLRYFDWAARATQRFMQAQLSQLVAPSGSVDGYVAAVERGVRGFLRQDLEFEARERARAAQRGDATQLALRWIQAGGGGDRFSAQRIRRLEENQTQQEAEVYQTRAVLREQ